MTSSPLDALFEKRLAQLTKVQFHDYLELHGLPLDVTWQDPQGKTWTARERLAFLACVAATDVSPSLFLHFLNQSTVGKWDASAPEEQRIRALCWLGVQRQLLPRAAVAAAPDWGDVLSVLSSQLTRSFAKQPIGTPASGFGEPGDRGWLSVAWSVLDEVQPEAALRGSSRPWSRVISAWLQGSLLNSVQYGGHRWWAFGGVHGTRKADTSPGDPGWETPGSLPGEVAWLGRGRGSRPLQLEGRWHAVAGQLLERLASAMEREQCWDVENELRVKAIEESKVPSHWMDQSIAQALVRIARASLLSPGPAAAGLIARYDGRSVRALEWLISAHAPREWFPPREQHALATALVEHAQRWGLSSNPREQEMVWTAGSLPRTHAPLLLWAKNVLAGPTPVVSAALPRPGP